MPSEIRKGDLFSFEGSYAHGVNCVGKMGKGIAVDFKERWPTMFLEYEKLCKEKQLFPGNIFPFETIDTDFEKFGTWRESFSNQLKTNLHKIPNLQDAPKEAYDTAYAVTQATIDIDIVGSFFTQRWIYNLCTKAHWKLPSETYMIWAALRNMVKHMEKNGVKEVAMPAIGCGLGELDWETQVKPIVEEIGRETECLLIVYLKE